jgi:dimethylglycine dehydrogenase
VGLSVAGPHSRDVLQTVAPGLDLSTEAFPFMTFRKVDLEMIPVHLARINYAGDLGYELWVRPEYQRALFDRIVEAGEPHGLRLFGMRALMSLRLEKSYGTWFREYRPIYTIPEAGLGRYVKLDHEFIGREAYERQVGAGPERRLVAFVLDVDPDEPADVIGDEPVWHDGKVVGWVTSGGFGHSVGQSIALGYVPTELAEADDGRFEIEVIGRRRPARIQPEPLFDPSGARMRA